MMKLDPSRVRRDLVHTFGFMYHLCDAPIQSARQLTVAEKLHGGFPRQYPSLWNDRTQPVTNDNRFYADSGIWLLDSLARYIRETGDVSALCEQVGTVEFVDIAEPGRGIRGAATIHSVAETALEILARYERLCADSPYGMVQILTGDWCDPVDMFGTDKIGDASRRGHGRGINARLSAHVFLTTLSTIEMLEAPGVVDALGPTFPSRSAVCRLRRFAETLRQSILRHAWEDGGNHCGFIDSIHELNADGRVPDAHKGEVGYTLGSIRPEREFDGIPRRVLTSMAFGLGLLLADRPYLSPIPDRDAKVAALLKTVDELLYHPEVGLRLYSTALANDEKTRRMVGRMGIIPSGCSENGEYHHAQAMMHRFRIEVPGESNTVWSQLGAILSVTRDAGLLGPFDSMANSYASDPKDPHFGAGMIFGFSGSADWIIDVVERIVGLELNLANGREPALRIRPNLPGQLGGRLNFSRVIHQHTGEGRFRQIPLHVRVRPANGRAEPRIMINGKAATEATIASLDAVDSIEIEMAIVG